MKNGVNVVKTLRAGNAVTRFHTSPLIVGETVGHHSCNVALLCNVLMEGKASRSLLLHALLHDVAEQFTGDIPYPFKREFPSLDKTLKTVESDWESTYDVAPPQLSELEHSVMKVADMLDLVYTAADEVCRGNQPLIKILETGLGVLQRVKLGGRAQGILDALVADIEENLDARGYRIER